MRRKNVEAKKPGEHGGELEIANLSAALKIDLSEEAVNKLQGIIYQHQALDSAMENIVAMKAGLCAISAAWWAEQKKLHPEVEGPEWRADIYTKKLFREMKIKSNEAV